MRQTLAEGLGSQLAASASLCCSFKQGARAPKCDTPPYSAGGAGELPALVPTSSFSRSLRKHTGI